jgi:putative transcriptional regulator
MAFSVAPGFLIAMPNLLDPNFFRSVVLIALHNEEGAFGLVLNQPLELPVEAVCREAKVHWEGPPDVRVYTGGPVERHRAWLLHGEDASFEGTQRIGQGVSVTCSPDGLEAYGRDPRGSYRLLLGYAGWGPGQLDREISSGAWLTAPLDARLIFTTPPERVWMMACRSVGFDPARLVDAGTVLN